MAGYESSTYARYLPIWRAPKGSKRRAFDELLPFSNVSDGTQRDRTPPEDVRSLPLMSLALQIFRAQARLLGNLAQHHRPDLFASVEGERNWRPTRTGETPVRPALAGDGPADAKESRK